MKQVNIISIICFVIALIVLIIAGITAQRIMITQETIIIQQDTIIQQNMLLYNRIPLNQNVNRRVKQQNNYTRAVYNMKTDIFMAMPRDDKAIVFLGDSITEAAPFSELLGSNVKNRGISGDTTEGVIRRLDELIILKPAKLFILIGINDIASGKSTQTIIFNIRTIVSSVQKASPGTKIYLQSLFPVNRGKFNVNIPLSSIKALNLEIKRAADEMYCTFIELYSIMLDKSEDELDVQYTIDGLHLNGKGVLKWVEYLKPYVNE